MTSWSTSPSARTFAISGLPLDLFGAMRAKLVPATRWTPRRSRARLRGLLPPGSTDTR